MLIDQKAVILLFLILISKCSATTEKLKCSMQGNITVRIGVIVDRNTRIGKEQEIAMKIAVHDLHKHSCNRFALHLRCSSQSSANATSIVMKLIQDKKVDALIGTLPFHETAVLSEIHKNPLGNIPIMFLAPIAIPPSLVSTRSPKLIQFAHDISIHTQCISALVGYFKWRRVTVIYEQSYSTFSLESEILASLYDSLKVVGATIAHHVAFPPIFSLSNPELVIEQELYKLKDGSDRVFVVLHSSLQLVTLLFQKAKNMGMLEKGFIWVVSDDIASMLDSVDPSVIATMQGIIGFKTNYVDKSKPFKEFKSKFEKSYFEKYPDEDNSNPSLYALRAYDAIQAIGKAAKFKPMLPNLLSSNFEGLSGNVSFTNGELERSPVFQIINVVRKSYEVLAFWSSEFGFTKEPPTLANRIDHARKEYVELGPINWPGTQQEFSREWTFKINNKKPIIIGVPASGAFHQFVNVSTEVGHNNRTIVTGFAIDVFNASLKNLPYDLNFKLVPFYGKYDELVKNIHLKVYDAAVGDITILGERYKWADFSQPYVTSGLSMIVTQKDGNIKEMWMFLMVFERKMWVLIPLMGLFIGFVVWSIEHGENSEFRHGSISQQIGTVFWFSFSVLLFTQRESPRCNLSRIVLAPWFFLVLMITIYFTASLTSQMTISQLLPSVKDVETLKRENAAVGCNWNSFTCTFLVNNLHFKPKNIRQIRSIDDYPMAFQSGKIKAAFFITTQAKVFLAKYCKGYTLAGPTYDFAGLGFAFSKGSSLSVDMSQAMLEAMESGEIATLESAMLSHYNCSTSTMNNPMTSIGPKPFLGLFYISGCIALMALVVTAISSIEKQWQILGVIKDAIVNRKLTSWALMTHSITLNRCRSALQFLRQSSNASSVNTP